MPLRNNYHPSAYEVWNQNSETARNNADTRRMEIDNQTLMARNLVEMLYKQASTQAQAQTAIQTQAENQANAMPTGPQGQRADIYKTIMEWKLKEQELADAQAKPRRERELEQFKTNERIREEREKMKIPGSRDKNVSIQWDDQGLGWKVPEGGGDPTPVINPATGKQMVSGTYARAVDKEEAVEGRAKNRYRQKLNDQLNTFTEKADDFRYHYNTIAESLNDPKIKRSVSDRALIFAFAYTLDPKDRVTEGDLKGMDALNSWFESFGLKLNSILAGKELDEHVRQSMLSVVANYANALGERKAAVINNLRKEAESYGIEDWNPATGETVMPTNKTNTKSYSDLWR